MKKIKNILLTVLGFILIAVAFAGVFIPVLPTTPFILLAIACLSGNPKIRDFILKNKFIKAHADNYKNRTGLPKKNLAFSLSFLWIVLIISMILTNKLWAYLLLIAVGCSVTIHLCVMAKPKKKKIEKESAADEKNNIKSDAA